MLRSRSIWPGYGQPKFCGACGSPLFPEVVPDPSRPRYDRRTGLDLGEPTMQVTWCRRGEEPDIVTETFEQRESVMHDNWQLRDEV